MPSSGDTLRGKFWQYCNDNGYLRKNLENACSIENQAPILINKCSISRNSFWVSISNLLAFKL